MELFALDLYLNPLATDEVTESRRKRGSHVSEGGYLLAKDTSKSAMDICVANRIHIILTNFETGI